MPRERVHWSSCGFLIRVHELQRKHGKNEGKNGSRSVLLLKFIDHSRLIFMFCGRKAPMQGVRQLKKIGYVPEHLKGLIIGKGRENLHKISTDTGVKFEVRGSNLFMDGSPDAIRKAHIEIKNQVAMVRNV